MKLLFCHDHVFLRVGDLYYSQGKLDYSKFSSYLESFNSVTCVGRYKCSNSVPIGYQLSSGSNVTVVGMDNLSSLSGLLKVNDVKNKLLQLISESDYIICRLPSEIGLLAFNLAKRIGKPVLCEFVASAYDCLYFKGGVAKLYAPILEWRMKQCASQSEFSIYVTKNYLQAKYPPGCKSISISDVMIDEIVEKSKQYPRGKVFRLGIIANPDIRLKGVDVAINAFKQLKESGVSVQGGIALC